MSQNFVDALVSYAILTFEILQILFSIGTFLRGKIFIRWLNVSLLNTRVN